MALCVKAVNGNDPTVYVIAVDDGIDFPKDGNWGDIGFGVQSGIKPFVYAQNCNKGIRTALCSPICDGVVLLNDDALLTTSGGFSTLAQAAKDHPEYGLIAATCNNVGNRNQWNRGIGLREDPRMVCFVAVYIPRTTIERVGLLDERYVAYGFEDDDYCLSVRRAGLKIGIHDGCYVDHGSLKSTFRGDPKARVNLQDGREIFIKKWGAYPL